MQSIKIHVTNSIATSGKPDTNMKCKNAILHLICNIPNITLRLRAGKHPGEELNNGDTDICISIPERKTGCPRDKSTRVKDVEYILKGGKCIEKAANFLGRLGRRFEMRLNQSLGIEITSVSYYFCQFLFPANLV